MSTLDVDQVRSNLEAQRSRLLDQLDDLDATPTGDLRSDVDYGDGFADAAAATAERTERLVLIETFKGQLDDVERALARVDDGSYGTCSRCGKQIPPERLEARPESTLCVECKTVQR